MLLLRGNQCHRVASNNRGSIHVERYKRFTKESLWREEAGVRRVCCVDKNGFAGKDFHVNLAQGSGLHSEDRSIASQSHPSLRGKETQHTKRKPDIADRAGSMKYRVPREL